jgi:hypothetical protein
MYAVVSSHRQVQRDENSTYPHHAEFCTESASEASTLAILKGMQAELEEHQRLLDAQKGQLNNLTDNINMLGLDAAVHIAGQLVSRTLYVTLGHGRGSRASRPCQIAIQHRHDPHHWGRNFVVFMRNNFTTDVTALEDLARSWDAVRDARIMVAHPEMLAEYNERKAVRLISILERYPDRSPIMTWTLHILKNRRAFLSAAPCPA